MKNTICSFSLLFTGAFAANVTAQCPFDPTISPANPILCPGGSAVLSTELYDSYQWFKDGLPIPGAIGQTHLVDAFTDGGSMFSVEATLAGCTEMSPSVLVDGWVFLLPTVMTTGSAPLYTDGFGVPHYCPGDTVLLVLMLPYDTLIQWTDDGLPISGATNDTLVVLYSGDFSVSGAPSLCPGFIQQLGVTIPIVFDVPIQPVISMSGATELCADPPGTGYQWFLDGLPIPGSNSQCIPITDVGAYTVFVTYVPDCSILSEGFVPMGLDEATGTPAWSVHPVPASDQVILSWANGSAITEWHLLDLTGREVMRSVRASISPLRIDVSGLTPGRYWFTSSEAPPVPFAVVR